MSTLTRTVDLAEIEVRSDGRTLEGTVMPWGQPASIVEPGGRYVEVFVRNAFDGTNPADVPLTRLHPRTGADLPIGVGVEFDDQPARLRGAWRVSDVDEGNQVLQLAHDRVPLGLSVGFVEVPGGSRWNHARTRVERLRAVMDHVAVVRAPAYAGALVTAVRGAGDLWRPNLAIARLRR